MQYTRGFYEDVFAPLMHGDEYTKMLQEQKDEIFKAKRQLFDQRREYNKARTPDARFDSLVDYIKESALEFNDFVPLQPKTYRVDPLDNEAVIVFADWHYGMVTDNIWNQFNVEICRQRVETLVAKAKAKIELHRPRKLHVLLLGDLAHGSIHVGCRVASEEDTCDQLMHVSELVAEAINELANCPSVESTNVYSTYGNHMRTIQNKSDSIHSDNMEKLLAWWLVPRLSKRDDIRIVEAEYKEFIKFNVCGYNICAVHGDLEKFKDFGITVNTIFSKKFGETIDYTISADKHHLEEFESFDIENILVRSLCGTDEFANNHRLFSSAGQTLMFFTKEDGRDTTCNIKFKEVNYG